MKKLLLYLNFSCAMGPVYVIFRLWYELAKKTGLLKVLFPGRGFGESTTTAHQWRLESGYFFFADRASLHLDGSVTETPRLTMPKIPAGTRWLENPCTGYRYSLKSHWSEITDLCPEKGDIKDVWNLSRFTFLYDLIRIDFHLSQDQAERAFAAMEDWILFNPVNYGPNWKCGQEISLRVLNWTFALHYFKDSPYLTSNRLENFLKSIRQHTRRVYANIHFSRIAVRNNHALTETLLLYIIGTLYPFFPESKKWKSKGKKWFEKEVAYQVNHEGAFLQHSMNYHRVVVQLFTWAIEIARKNGDRWKPVVYNRARASLNFLTTLQDELSGKLPHYGSNDGALFFPLNSCHIRDFRPQLGALAAALGQKPAYPPGPWQEDTFWLFGKPMYETPPYRKDHLLHFSYEKSGYFIAKTPEKLLFIRCGSYRSRPSQSDNLHLDLWENGVNLLFDAGTFRYNTDDGYKAYFSGTEAHNTVALEHFDQMLRGPQFIWSHWIKEASGKWRPHPNKLVFEGCFKGYRHLRAKGILHKRTVTTDYELKDFVVRDCLSDMPGGLQMRQLWHPAPEFFERYTLTAADKSGNEIAQRHLNGWYADRYGEKKKITYIEYGSFSDTIETRITRRDKKIG